MNYLMKYKGKYRLKAPYDLNTNNFSRKLNGNYEDIDVYISCSNGIKVFYAGKGILELYIPSLQRGHNILKQLYYENINPDNVEVIQKTIIRDGKEVVRTTHNIINKDLYESELKSSKFFYDIRELDSETTFRIHKKDFEKVIPIIKPKTSGAGISPFSTKNLPKRKYEISDDQLREYKNINDSIPQSDKLKLSRITNDFISNVMSKNKQYKSVDMKKLMRKKMLNGKEFIHEEGFWNEYISYLKKRLGEEK